LDFYNTTRFSGKKLVVHPGNATPVSIAASITFWCGAAKEILMVTNRGCNPNMDELLVCHDKAITPLVVRTPAPMRS
jgi:hypothetical protein